jgi:hypothetical protein
MSVRTNVIAIALATLAVPAAFAQSSSVFVGGERGWVDGPVKSSTTRQQVTNEYLQFRSNPVMADGGRYVGGQEGYVFPKHIVALQNGQLVCADNIPHNPPPPTITSNAQVRAFKQQYPA